MYINTKTPPDFNRVIAYLEERGVAIQLRDRNNGAISASVSEAFVCEMIAQIDPSDEITYGEEPLVPLN